MLEESLNILKKYWFQENARKDIWFQSDQQKRELLDEYIYNNFQKSLVIVEKLKLETIRKFTIDNISSCILLLDQISRHIYRYKHNFKIKNNTEKCINLTFYILLNDCSSLSNEQLLFILMPLKHIDINRYFPIIKNTVSKRIDIACPVHSNLYSFYLDSLKKYSIEQMSISSMNNVNFQDLYTENDLSSVCEKYFEKPQESTNIREELVKVCNQFLDSLKIDSLTISLSGGPDSMVLTFILQSLCIKRNISLNAFHINYNNRPESINEEFVIRKFCDQIKIKLFVYRFNYFKRCEIQREIYEKFTRKIRFDMYRNLGGEIVLGHIKEDLIENIWTNFANGRDLFKLHKMDIMSVNDGINIYRPFIRIEKHKIFKFAEEYNICYLKNTTPEWSNRGKIRNKFIPQVNTQFGKDTSDKILYLSDSLASYKEILDRKIFEPLYQQIKYINFGIKLDIKDYRNMPLHFWETVLTRIYHILCINKPSMKSINLFIERLKMRKYGYLTLKDRTICYFDKFSQLYILDKKRIHQNINYVDLTWNKLKLYLE